MKSRKLFNQLPAFEFIAGRAALLCRRGNGRPAGLPYHLLRFLQRGQTSIHGVLAEFLFDAEELVVFRQTIRAAERADLNLTTLFPAITTNK